MANLFRESKARRELERSFKDRAKAMLPLCEQVSGIKRESELKIETLSPTHLFLRHMKHWAKNKIFGVDADNFPSFKMALQMAWHSSRNSALHFDSREGKVCMIYKNFIKSPGALRQDAFDYYVAHEISHFLTFGLIKEEFKHNNAVREGLACFYGELSAKVLHPVFDLETARSHITGERLLYIGPWYYPIGYREMKQTVARGESVNSVFLNPQNY